MQEKIPDLKQFRKESNRHVLVLEAQVSEQDKYKLIHLSNNVLRTAGNDLTGVMKKNYDQLVRTKRYRHLQSLYGKAKKAGRDKEMKAVGAEMKQMQEEYHVTWEFCRQSMIKINKQYHLNSIFALTQAEDVWKGVEACLYREGKTLHFRKYGDHPEIRAKQAVRGIIVRLDGGSLNFRIGDITLFPIINKPGHTKTRRGHDTGVKEVHDLFAEEEIAAVCHYLENPEAADRAALELFRKKGELMDTYRPCYASLCFKEIRGRVRVFIHLTIEGLPKPKRRKDGSRRHQLGRGVVGCDIGPQTIACTSKKEVILKNLAERGMSIKKTGAEGSCHPEEDGPFQTGHEPGKLQGGRHHPKREKDLEEVQAVPETPEAVPQSEQDRCREPAFCHQRGREPYPGAWECVRDRTRQCKEAAEAGKEDGASGGAV